MDTYTYQSRLGATSTKDLTIANPSGPVSALSSIVQPEQAYVFRLPDEILCSVLQCANDTCPSSSCLELDRYSGECGRCCLRVLIRVCHKLRNLAEPLLYFAIGIKDYKRRWWEAAPVRPILKLHRTLKQRPDLWQHCRSLYVAPDYFMPRNPRKYDPPLDFVKWLTKIRSLTVEGRFQDTSERNDEYGNRRTWDVIRHAANTLKEVENLELRAQDHCVTLPPMIMLLTFAQLQKLEIWGLSTGQHATEYIEAEKYRTAAFSSLYVEGWNNKGALQNIVPLFQWPKALTHFECRGFPQNIGYLTMVSWLLPHKNTLKSIKLGPIARDLSHKSGFNATLFPKLNFLQTSKLDIPHPVLFTADCTNLLGPSLVSYCWDWTYSDYEYGCCGTLKFGDPEFLWIESLARSSVALQAALKKIVIKHVPRDWDIYLRPDAVYRWDELHKLRDQVLRPLGISLVYNPLEGYEKKDHPSTSEEEEEEEVAAVDQDPQTPPKYHGEDIRGYFKQ